MGINLNINGKEVFFDKKIKLSDITNGDKSRR